IRYIMLSSISFVWLSDWRKPARAPFFGGAVRPPVYTVPVQSAKKVISAAACRIRPEDLCEAAELDPSQLQDPPARIPWSLTCPRCSERFSLPRQCIRPPCSQATAPKRCLTITTRHSPAAQLL